MKFKQATWLFNPSLPECLMEICKVTLTFQSVDKILRCDHSNESSLPLLSHDAICFPNFHKMKFGPNLLLAEFGSERVKHQHKTT